jgi:xylonate dehydratase
MDPDTARRARADEHDGVPVGNLAPEGSVIKATAIDPAVVDADGSTGIAARTRLHRRARGHRAVKGDTVKPVRPGDVMVLAGAGPSGTGMQETYQITTALKLPALGQARRR